MATTTTKTETENLPTETVQVAAPVAKAAADIGEQVKPLIAAAFQTETNQEQTSAAIAWQLIPLFRLFDENGKPQWNRKNINAAFAGYVDGFYSGAVNIPPASDLTKSTERFDMLKTLNRLRKRVDAALVGESQRGVLQQAIVAYCESQMDPAFTIPELSARRPIDAGSVTYWNHASLPTRLVKAVQAEYQRCGLKLPVNLGGTSGTGNSVSPGASPLNITTTLEHVITATKDRAGSKGGTSIAALMEQHANLAVAIYAKYAELRDTGVAVPGGDKIAVQARRAQLAAEGVGLIALSKMTAAKRSELANALGVGAVGPAKQEGTGVQSGAEEEKPRKRTPKKESSLA